MKAFTDIQAWRCESFSRSLGFVPTMGALHAGHLELVKRSRTENEQTAVSIFVNPTQFDDPADLRAYPKTLESDLKLLEEAGVDYVLVPTAEQMYPDGYRYRVSEHRDSVVLEGANRPGHFEGMLTVVLKLLMLSRARRAYFGEKDYQQLHLVQGMVRDFFLEVEIVPVATVREPDGLALSSRNARLNPEARTLAAHLPHILQTSDDPQTAKGLLAEAGFEVDYVEDWQDRRLAAVRLAIPGGKIRLIDNFPVKC